MFDVSEIPMPPPKPAIVEKAMPAPRLKAAPAVAARPFHASHNCYRCGTYQAKVHTGIANVYGHSHKCGRCGAEWWH